MVFELQCRQLVRFVNDQTVLGIPVINAVIALIELAIMSRLIGKFNHYYAKRPLLTMMISNAVLGGMADTVAQTITSVRQRAVRSPGGVSQDDTAAIEIHELDKRNPLNEEDLIPNSDVLPPPFDFERLSRFMGYGFCMAPLQFKWFQLLSKMFPMGANAGMGQALKRMVVDQSVFAPFGLVVFFTAMTLAEGGTTTQVKHKLKDMYLPTLKANYILWPAVQILNFRVVPIQFQLPFVSSVGIAWTAYLSLTNAAEDARESESSRNENAIQL